MDAFVLGWAQHAHLALAIGDSGGYGWAWAAKALDAERRAIANCGDQTTNCRLVVVIDTDQR